ncbi:VapC toxin family PIN domain ribonuclease [Candidatus Desantisbacteria bacterium CG2_30_40_21]|uniref:Ribonuclease VapC n=5 Tax=unclassified Candidatus Desantisiibacteriota TaxID=3106372 RepID=A0A2M7JBK3_9BACT|nr:MAG: VapC toxin family PIN domain ribonuclease [Candidatus Desantisbacteria bacterium CG2_30_40_21]PIP40309.1 MAG: VapC toxin family PIN domain ribonuclease [Candidatus Desantisbacteria bacterium CG23_combo_of_CG06-09_8_20_14_all_40_23]PIX16743.1 MAG: VapC toxin family PIN domain ribonuclease [Candidatus Desantisbacteria bacterium CG_4_8_14_3_um_filter_40_12]PIY19255.1 MAG: VapC toxin family PIN domain ribonuclease [Candidatus Desantisbacteria bacterium CG_4_10_14_3_um_filter_40_18]PJB28569.
MRYLLDTNVCIQYLNGRSEGIRQQLNQRTPEKIVLCSVVKAELFYGVLKSKNPTRNLERQLQFGGYFVSLPFDDKAAEVYGQIRVQLEKRGTPIGPNDLMIAAIAVANDVVLVTHNTREFGRIEHLKFEDWERFESSLKY